jgi:formylmethanofuran dehydrogenase subunit B
MPPSRPGHRAYAWFEGKSCTLDEAVAAAAAHLRRSRQPLFAGLGCDISGVRAVVRLAGKTEGVVDCAGRDHRRSLDVLRDAGMVLTTPGETIARADTIIVIEGAVSSVDQGLLDRIIKAPPKLAASNRRRRVVWLGRGGRHAQPGAGVKIKHISLPASQIGTGLATLRSRLAGRPVSAAPIRRRDVESLLEVLRATSFGVVIWSPIDLDQFSIQMLAGLVRDLNLTTRFSSLESARANDLATAAMAMTWLTGFPSNVGFARGETAHDPWRFDAARLAHSGEIDLAVWISSYHVGWPVWGSRVPVIALTSSAGPECRKGARIAIKVGRPGIDHDAVASSAATGGLAFLAATKPSGLPSVADILGAIEVAFDSLEGARR